MTSSPSIPLSEALAHPERVAGRVIHPDIPYHPHGLSTALAARIVGIPTIHVRISESAFKTLVDGLGSSLQFGEVDNEPAIVVITADRRILFTVETTL